MQKGIGCHPKGTCSLLNNDCPYYPISIIRGRVVVPCILEEFHVKCPIFFLGDCIVFKKVCKAFFIC